MQNIIQTFYEAINKRLSGTLFKTFIAETPHPDTFISTDAQRETHLYLTIFEELENNAVSCPRQKFHIRVPSFTRS